MKVLLINGSPRQNGNTATALGEVAAQLKRNGIESEIAWIGNKPVRGCIACNQCKAKVSVSCPCRTKLIVETMPIRCSSSSKSVVFQHGFTTERVTGTLIIWRHEVRT